MSSLTICFSLFLMLLSSSSSYYYSCFAHDGLDSHVFPRHLIVEYQQGSEIHSLEALRFQCTSWRFAVETNNMSPWKSVPVECADYVKDYMTSRAYVVDLETVSKEAATFAKSLELGEDGLDAWVFDVDETLLSNLPYYAEHGYGVELFDETEFNKWVQEGEAPAILPSLELYRDVLSLGFKIFFLTGRNELHRIITINNLSKVGFQHWDKLILRSSEEHSKQAIIFKSEKRDDMVKEGYRILGNSGDQWSDLLGSSAASRSFKLPNPMYHIS